MVLLSTAALLSMGDGQSVEATMKQDKETANICIHQIKDQINSTQTDDNSREATTAAMKADAKEAVDILNKLNEVAIGQKTNVYYEEYTRAKDEWTVARYSMNGIMLGNDLTGANKESSLYHERQHEIFANKTIPIADGTVMFAENAPMSLVQHYKTEQSNEIAANIAEVLNIRQQYVAIHTDFETSKQNTLLTLAENSSENAQTLSQAIENGARITKKDNVYKIKEDGKKAVQVDLNKNTELCETVNNYISKQTAVETFDDDLPDLANTELRKSTIDWYIQKLANKEIDPLTTDPTKFEQEMEMIGRTVTANWCDGIGLGYEDRQIIPRTISFMDENGADMSKLKTNNKNYDAAMDTCCTIGGYNFSKSVKSELEKRTVPEQIENLQQSIDNKGSYLTVRTQAENMGLKEKDDAFPLLVGTIAKEVLSKGNGESTNPLPVYWSKEDAKSYKEFKKRCDKLPEEKKNLISKQLKELNLDKKKVGEEFTPEEYKKTRQLCSEFDILDTTCLPLDHLLRNYREKESIVSTAEKEEYKKALEAYGKSPEEIEKMEEKVFRGIKRAILDEKEKEIFTARPTIRTTGQGIKEEKIIDFDTPFLKNHLDNLKKDKVEDAKTRAQKALAKLRENNTSATPKTSLAQQNKENCNTTNTPPAPNVVVAYKNQGR